jgi:hypothetical protein
MRRRFQHEFPHGNSLGVTVFATHTDINSRLEKLESNSKMDVSSSFDYRSIISLTYLHAIQLLALIEQK